MPIASLRITTLAVAGVVLALAGCAEEPPLQRMLSLVPADTPYAFVAGKALPDPLYSRIMAMGEQEMRGSLKRWRELLASQQAAGEVDPTLAEGARVLDALAAELDGHYSGQGARDLGFGPDTLGVFYGLGPFPAMRSHMTDPARVAAFIARVEQRYGAPAPRAELNGLSYRRMALGPELSLVVALQDQDLVMGVVPNAAAPQLLPLLFGFAPPADSLAASGTLTKLQARYQFEGYAEGYLDLRRVLQLFTGRGQGEGAAALRALVSDLPAPTPGCLGLLDAVADGVPRLAVGINDVQADSYQLTAAYETAAPVSDHLQQLARTQPLPGMAMADPAMASMGVNLNVPATREAIKALMRFIAQAGEGCEWVDSQALLAGMPKVDFMLGPMLAGLSGAYAQLAEVRFDEQTGAPEGVRGGLLLAVSDPRGLVAMAAMMNPEMGQLELPADGSAVQVPPGLLPPQLPSLYLAAGEGLLAVASGDDGAERAAAMLRAGRSAEPVVLTLSYDMARFVGVMDYSMGMAAAQLRASGEEAQAAAIREQLDGFHAMAEHFGRIDLSVAPGVGALLMKQRVELR